MNILGTGLSGMVGSQIVSQLGEKYSFADMSLQNGIDIRNRAQVFDEVGTSDAPIVIHFAAKTDVDGCEKDKDQDSRIQGFKDSKILTIIDRNFISSIDWKKWENENTAFAINVAGTKNIAEACTKYNKKLMYVSTDFVFSGREKKEYTEDDIPEPLNYYSQTKWWGEQVVAQICKDWIIMRLAYPYGRGSGPKQDFVERIRNRLKENQEVLGITDQIFTPTLIADIGEALHLLISTASKGIYHVVGNTAFSPYDAALAIVEEFGYDRHLVKKTTAREFYLGRAVRPNYLRISNTKIKSLGLTPHSFKEGLKKIQ